MRLKNSHRLIDGIARDGREFGHMTENLRDALLNGARRVEFGIMGLSDPTAVCVARRVIADDGDGMGKSTLGDTYAAFGETATKYDFDVQLDADGNVTTDVVEVGEIDQMHARRGVGGRASLSQWNPLGVVTVTVHQGVANMVWMFRSIEGVPEMREWSDFGKRAKVQPPYAEPAELSFDDIRIDRSFARMMLVRGGLVGTEDDADEFIETFGEDEVMDNPFYGIDWQDAVPQWVVHHWGEDGLAYREDGELAHGCVKILLGENLQHSTAITGDPAFPNEAVPTRYNGALTAAWLDLSQWEVKVWTMVKFDPTKTVRSDPTKTEGDKHVPYQLHGHAGHYKLDGGKPRDRSEISGRIQRGAYGMRTHGGRAAYQTVLDLGQYGNAALIVSGSEKSSSYDASRTDGALAVVYGNELHAIANSGKLQGEGYQYRNMGISTKGGFEKRVSLFFFLPRATDHSQGVFQALARDSLKWTGMDRLPLTDEAGIYAAVRDALPDDFLELMNGEATASEYKVDQSRYKHLESLLNAGKAEGKGATSAPTSEVSVGIEQPTGTITGVDAGPQGAPGDTPRTPCPLCGLVVHADDCKNKPAPRIRTSDVPTGSKLRRRKVAPDETGTLTARKSRAKAHVGEIKPDHVELQAPDIDWSDEPVDGDERVPVTWVARGETALTEKGDTGTIVIWRQHLAVKAIFKEGEKAGRDKDETEAVVREWIGRNLTDGLMGMLALAERDLGVKRMTRVDLEEMIERLGQTDLWLMLVASLFADTASLASHIKGTARRTARKTKAA
jgi:hypothetical protein